MVTKLMKYQKFECLEEIEMINVVTWRRSRIIKLLFICGAVIWISFLFVSTNQDAFLFLWKQRPWFTPDLVGNFEPNQTKVKDGPGEGGKPFKLHENVTNTREINNFRRKYGVNMAASDAISLERSIPDTRMDECKYWNYPEDMQLKTSVVIAFYNEGQSTLLRNVHTILKRTPTVLLEEIVLVDDFSDIENLKEDLDQYIKRFQGKVRIIRNQEREGLIRTRSIGAEQSRGDVVVFLDAHCEVNRNWLPPLLAPIYRDRTIMTVPFIDGINHETFEYHPVYDSGNLFRGIFEWGLLYKEIQVTQTENARKTYKSVPYKSPTHAGGLFAIDRKYFLELGGYDLGLLGWGAENFELSFKIWQCGGSIEWVPCSRVGHIYRRVPYGFGKLNKNVKGSITKINYKRVVEVWLDEKYKEFFYTRDPMTRYLDHGDISMQLALKKRLGCRSFAWFMNNIASDLLTKFPELPKNLFWGEIKNVGSKLCLDNLGHPAPSKMGMEECRGTGNNQLLRLNSAGQLGIGERCLQIDNDKSILKQIVCPPGQVQGSWVYNLEDRILKDGVSNKCVTVQPSTYKIIISDCQPTNSYHQWTWRKLAQRN